MGRGSDWQWRQWAGILDQVTPERLADLLALRGEHQPLDATINGVLAPFDGSPSLEPVHEGRETGGRVVEAFCQIAHWNRLARNEA